MPQQSTQLPPLSQLGQRRRDDILRDVLTQAKRRRVRRKAAKTLGVCAVMLGVIGLYALRPRSTPPLITTPDPIAPPVIARAPETAAPAFTRIAFAEIQTDRAILSRYVLRRDEEDRPKVMNDDELLKSLHQAGVDAGIAHVGSQALVVLNDKFLTPGQE